MSVSVIVPTFDAADGIAASKDRPEIISRL